MPGEVLTAGGDAGQSRPGFFGKLPATGDFVARGLPDALRQSWDRWVTRPLAPRQRAGAVWPEGGLRFRLVSGGRAAGGVVVPSADSAGRGFPLSLVLIGDALPGPAGLDPWCDSALAAVGDGAGIGADQLFDLLASLAPPEGEPGGGPFQLWTAAAALPADPENPGPVLDTLFTAPAPVSSGESSSP